MELTFVVTVKNVWQLQPSWLHPCKVCDQGRSVGKINFTRNRKMVGLWVTNHNCILIFEFKTTTVISTHGKLYGYLFSCLISAGL